MTEVTMGHLLDKIYYSSGSEYDKGARFERLTKRFLELDPTYAQQFSKVVPWSEWEERTGQDVGIDLVAYERDGGGICAIQCKFYDPERTISKGDIDSFLSASGKYPFTSRLLVSTTTRWGKNAEEAIRNQQIPVSRIGLEQLEESLVDWSKFDITTPEVMELKGRKELRGYQRDALEDVAEGFKEHDRGKLIMACGTGKTFTSLKIVEDQVKPGGTVLFLVPSLALLSQALWAWTQEATVPMRTFAVCSDVQVNKKRGSKDEDISAVDLVVPATTDPHKLEAGLARNAPEDITVVFATYQSLDVIHRAQELGAPEFDLVICDEAHRTTGARLASKEESTFTRVHDNKYLKANKRLYMTATPRIYAPTAKAKSQSEDIVLASMDDETLYGPEFHRLGFGDAVRQKLLTDYKVVALAVSEDKVSRVFQSAMEHDNLLTLPDIAKIVGVWSAIAKRSVSEEDFKDDPEPMQRLVAFANTIKGSKSFTETFEEVINNYKATMREEADEESELPEVTTAHVDGAMNMLERDERMAWLKGSSNELDARVLSNARCLSEGVDVPTLDGVAFLNPRKSQVDIVQAVGRVMRLAPGKEYGYIILPIAIPAGMTAEEALDNSDAYKAVWEVLQALRSHDERFDAMINQIELNKTKPGNVIFTTAQLPGDENETIQNGETNKETQTIIDLSALDSWRDAVYAKLVQKVGDTRYWETWAKDVAAIAARHRTRLTALIDQPATADEFARFHKALQANLNEGVTEADSIDMLSQHLITKPVFEALFEDYDFSANPVSQVMERMLQVLEPGNLEAELQQLEGFYTSVRERARGIDNAASKQKVAIELYEKFFKTAFEKTAKSLGIVYTPIEVVDFILRSTEDLLKEHFGVSISDEGVHVLDPFTGTGTFVVRLIQSGLISPHDLARKYAHELHANEILLLAYYIAAVNIEVAYQEQMSENGEPVPYSPFPGIVLTDTFQITEEDDAIDADFFKMNNKRVEQQLKLDIRVIVGNPPYSVGQTSANDDAANQKYPTLDQRIEETYAYRSSARLKRSLYDSYVRALRWSSDRIKDKGVIGYVTNGGFLDSNTADGLRKTLQDEFAHIYIYNLRGNARTSGELRRKEKDSVFGQGGRTTIVIMLLVKDPEHDGPGTLHYHDIGDYLDREAKLELVDSATIENLPWRTPEPNSHGDWINQRSDTFPTWQPIGDKDAKGPVFTVHSAGLKTNRDAWVYSFNRKGLASRVQNAITYYNEHASSGLMPTARDSTKFTWDRSDRANVVRGRQYQYDPDRIYLSQYRPFTKQNVYFDRSFNNTVYRLYEIFPTPATENYGFYILGIGATKPFSALATDQLPDHSLYGSEGGQFFPRYTYERDDDSMLDVGTGGVVDGYRKRDNVTDATLADYQATYGSDVSKDDIFAYVYGLLHSPDYRDRFAADLKRMLPHIPKVSSAQDFWAFTDAGKGLLDLHIGYEDVEAYPLEIEEQFDPGMDAYDFYRVTKLVYGGTHKNRDMTTIVYNPYVTVRGIPLEAQDYKLGSRSALDWIIDRYRVTTDKASGIVNDPNDWAKEVGNPKYILDLIGKVTTVSLETMRIVDSLPSLEVAPIEGEG